MRDCVGWGEGEGEGEGGGGPAAGASLEPRDLLPDLVADAADGGSRLSSADRTRLLAHVATCAECQAELQLVRTARRAGWAVTPPTDIAAIVSALPRRPGMVGSRVPPGAYRYAWRIAAVISTVAVGALSVAVLQNRMRPPVRTAPSIQLPVPAAAASPPEVAQLPARSPHVSAPAHVAPAPVGAMATEVASTEPEGGLEVGGRLADLSDAQLNELLGDIDRLDAVPEGEPDLAGPALSARGGESL